VTISPRGVAVVLAASLTLTAQAQSPSAPPAPAQHQSGQTDIERVDEIVATSKFTVKKIDNPKQPVWTIKRKGESLKEFDVLFFVKNGVLVTFVTVVPKANLKRTPDLLEKMLKMNFKYDSVKIGFDDDDDAYVRMDLRLRIVDVQEFNQIIDQVSMVADTLHTELKPFMISG
jgi:hypothetical protein